MLFYGLTIMWFSLLLFVVIVFIIVRRFRKPELTANWTAIHKKNPTVSFDNNVINIKNIKDFSYFDSGKINETHYFDNSFDVTEVKAVWYGVAHFSKFGIAHAFLSFEFNNGQFLVTSIEARRKSKEKFSPLKGFFNQYNKIIVFGTERDIIGLRSHTLKHQVYLYPLQIDALEAQNLFNGVARDAYKLQTQPEFYNTLLDNCFTGIAKFSHHWNVFRSIFDYRVLLPGFSDDLVQKMGLLDKSLSIKQLRTKAFLDPSNSHPKHKDFSKQIRKNYLDKSI